MFENWQSLKSVLESYDHETVVIYCVRNTKNDKHYVGKTKGDFVKRLKGHINEAFVKNSKYAFHCAIRKHGVESFEARILEQPGLELLRDREIFWINEMSSFKNGYNMTIGGDGIDGFKHSDETRKRISDKKKGVPLDPSLRQNLMKQVQQCDESGNVIRTFESIIAASKETGVGNSNIGCCCRGKLPNAGGFIWRFVNERDAKKCSWSDEKRQKMKERLSEYDPRCKRVACVDLQTNEIVCEYDSVRDAHSITGITNISMVCRGVRRSAGGFFWKYLNSSPAK